MTLDHEHLGPTGVYARTEHSAVSIGTEVAAYAGKEPLRPGRAYPRLLGYSNVARVMGVGTAVGDLRSGDRIFTNQSHQSAFVCDRNDVLAVIPVEVPSPLSTLVYIANLSFSSFQRASLQQGETVAILGLGPIGLAAVAVAKTMGARVIAIGNAKVRLDRARALGADLCLRAGGEGTLRALDKATGRKDVDLVLTTVNSWDGWLLALKLTCYGGRIVVLGFPGRGEDPPPFNPLATHYTYVKQLRIYHCGLTKRAAAERCQGDVKDNLKALLDMMRGGVLRLETLVTHRVPWTDLERIYKIALRGDKGLVTAVLDWNLQET